MCWRYYLDHAQIVVDEKGTTGKVPSQARIRLINVEIGIPSEDSWLTIGLEIKLEFWYDICLCSTSSERHLSWYLRSKPWCIHPTWINHGASPAGDFWTGGFLWAGYIRSRIPSVSSHYLMFCGTLSKLPGALIVLHLWHIEPDYTPLQLIFRTTSRQPWSYIKYRKGLPLNLLRQFLIRLIHHECDTSKRGAWTSSSWKLHATSSREFGSLPLHQKSSPQPRI